MKTVLIIMFVLSFTVLAHANRNIFYDATQNKQIVDISGEKTKAQIAEEFSIPEENLQEMIIKDGEGVKIVDGVMVKTDLIKEQKKIEKQKKDKKEAKQKPVIKKLKSQGWTNEEIDILLDR